MNYKIITDPNDITKELWDKFLIEHPNGNFFHTQIAFEFFQSVENFEPVLITDEVRDEIKGILFAVIIREPGIKGIFSKRCIIWGGPLLNSKETASEIINRFNEYVKNKAIYTEFRNLFDVSDLNDIFIKEGYEFEERVNYIVAIESIEANKKKLNENRKRQIKKSLKSGVKIVQPDSVEQVKQFYSILKQLYTTKVKKPLPSFDFFEKFFELKDSGKYFLIKFEGRIIGGLMSPVYRDTIYEWYVCGLDSEYKEQSPSVLATWAAIEYAANNGLKYFDFMGAGKPDDDYGVREFKSKFGGEEFRFGRYIKINKPVMYWIGKTGLKILQKLE